MSPNGPVPQPRLRVAVHRFDASGRRVHSARQLDLQRLQLLEKRFKAAAARQARRQERDEKKEREEREKGDTSEDFTRVAEEAATSAADSLAEHAYASSPHRQRSSGNDSRSAAAAAAAASSSSSSSFSSSGSGMTTTFGSESLLHTDDGSLGGGHNGGLGRAKLLDSELQEASLRAERAHDEALAAGVDPTEVAEAVAEVSWLVS